MTLQIRNDALVELLRGDFYSRDDELVLSDDRWIELDERSPAPALPAADRIRLFARDDGGGNSQFCFIDAAGNVVCSGGGVAAPHNILSATHTDSVVQAVTRGSIIYADAAPAWNELTHPGADYVLGTDANDVLWKLAATNVPLPPVAQGDILIADATPAWSILTVGAQFTHLEAGAATATWVTDITMLDDATIGLSGGGNLDFNSTPATDVLNFASCNVGVNEVAPGAMLHVTASGAAVIGLIIELAAAPSVDAWQVHSSGGANILSGADERGILFSDGGTDPTNLFLGADAGNTTATGNNNFGMGGRALRDLTTGTSDVAIGADTMLLATTATSCIAIGGGALIRNLQGNQNTVVGAGAFNFLNSINAFLNVAIGTSTGATTPTAPQKCTFIGALANSSLAAPTRAVAIGHLAIVAANSTMVLGGTGADSVQVAINATTATAQLDVNINAAARIGQIIKGAAAQSANLVEYQDSTTAIFFESGDGLVNSTTTWNQQGLDINFVIEAVGVADAFVVDGAAGQITLGALGAGSVQSSAGGVLSVVNPAITYPIAPVAQGDMLVADATPAWSVLTLGAAAGYALVSTATTAAWDQTPSWTGLHSFAAGITFSGASGANNVTIPDNVALAIELLDAGGLEYLRIVSSNAQPTINWNANSADIDWIIEAVGVVDAFQVRGSNGEITLGALGAGVVRSTAAGVLSSGAVPLTDLASYAQGSIIIGGGVDWEALTIGAASTHLESDGTDIAWQVNITLADGATVGQAAGPLLTFNDAGNILQLAGGDLHMNNGAADTVKIRRSGDVQNAVADIYAESQLGLAADSNIHVFIDADNSGTTAFFAIQKNAENVAAATEVMRVTEAPILFLNETSNANMTIGVTLDQGASDDEIFNARSSDVGAVLSSVETNTYFTLEKVNGGAGGVVLSGFRDAGGTATAAMRILGYLAENIDTTKTQAGRAITEVVGFQTDGTNRANTVADGNVVAFRTQRGGGTVTLFIVDEDGDLFADGGIASTDMVTLFDDYKDAELVRAFDIVRGPEQVIRSEFDRYIEYNENTLVEAGILGAPIADGGLINVTRLQQLHNGAIWQNYCEIRELHGALTRANEALIGLGADPVALIGG